MQIKMLPTFSKLNSFSTHQQLNQASTQYDPVLNFDSCHSLSLKRFKTPSMAMSKASLVLPKPSIVFAYTKLGINSITFSLIFLTSSLLYLSRTLFIYRPFLTSRGSINTE